MTGEEILDMMIPLIENQDEAGFHAFWSTLTKEEIVNYKQYIKNLKSIMDYMSSL